MLECAKLVLSLYGSRSVCGVCVSVFDFSLLLKVQTHFEPTFHAPGGCRHDFKQQACSRATVTVHYRRLALSPPGSSTVVQHRC